MFVKIFEQIHDSSVASDYLQRLVFMDFLIMADRDGVVNKTPDAIARRTNVPIEIVQAQIAKLCAPDPISNTPDHEGRRLMPLSPDKPWGWVIVNYRLYRNIKSSDELRAKTRERVARWRENQKLNGEGPKTAPEAVEENRKKPLVRPSLEEVKLIAAKTGLPEREAEKFFQYYEANGWKVGKNPMRSVAHALGGWKMRWEEAGRPMPPSPRRSQALP